MILSHSFALEYVSDIIWSQKCDFGLIVTWNMRRACNLDIIVTEKVF